MKKLILIILLLNSIIGFSQNEKTKEILIKGTVYSGVNNRPFDYGVYLFFQKKHKGTISNDKGEFEYSYKLKEKDSLEIIEFSTIGYGTKKVEIDLIKDNLSDLKIVLVPPNDINKEKALQDIENGKINILISSGIVPVEYKADRKFMKKYSVSFKEFGCEAIAQESLIEYNKVVFEYLDRKFGNKWRIKIRKDIVGLKKEN